MRSVLLLFLPLAFASAQAPPAGAAKPLRWIRIQLNGQLLAEGIAFRSRAGEEIVIPVSALARALDGRVAAGSRVSQRLRLEGRKLFAALSGGCESCPARVTRPVMISARVRAVDGIAVFPLSDLVAAFEGRLEVDSARTLFDIHAGKCTWCILEPSERSHP